MMILKNNGAQPTLAIQKSRTTLDFIITNEKIRISCTLESLVQLGNETYVIFRDESNKMYAYLIKSPYSDRPMLIKPSADVEFKILQNYTYNILGM